jgi:two-component system NtrC family response regulator
MAEGAFREDLYYRISVVTVTLPPLRSRGEDVTLLATLFLRRFSDDFRKKVRGFSSSALEAIRSYAWPGNVRELENRVQRAVLMSAANMVEPDDLGFDQYSGLSGAKGSTLNLRAARERLETDMIRGALTSNGGNIAKAADDLGVSRPTLYDLIKKYGIEA